MVTQVPIICATPSRKQTSGHLAQLMPDECSVQIHGLGYDSSLISSVAIIRVYTDSDGAAGGTAFSLPIAVLGRGTLSLTHCGCPGFFLWRDYWRASAPPSMHLALVAP